MARDYKCTCPCGKGMRPEFSRLREDRGRICADCQSADAIQAMEDEEAKMEACICWPNDFNGRSVCGTPCPAHPPKAQ